MPAAIINMTMTTEHAVAPVVTGCCVPAAPMSASLLRLLAWLSPAFPTGAFAYSHGLEWAVEAGDVSDDQHAAGWLTDVLQHGAGRGDTILLRHAHRAARDADRTRATLRNSPPRSRQAANG